MMASAIGGDRCQAPGELYSEYEASVGTGQVHVWFERPADGWTGRGRPPDGATRKHGERGAPRWRSRTRRWATNASAEARLTLVDVWPNRSASWVRCSRRAFIIPLIIGVNFAATGCGRRRPPLSVLLAAVGVFALGWIVAQYAKRIHAAGSLYDYVSKGSGRPWVRPAAGSTTRGTIILTTGLGVLIGGYIHDSLLPTFEIEARSCRSGSGTCVVARRCCSRSCTSGCRSRRGCSCARLDLDRRRAGLLRHRDRRARR